MSNPYREIVSRLDDLVKSRFIEMFGTISDPKYQKKMISELVQKKKNALKTGPFGSSLKKELYVKDGYKIYGQEQVISGNPFFGDYYIDQKKYEELSAYKIEPNDVLISMVGSFGNILVLPENCLPGIINPRLVKISFDSSLINTKYFEILFKSDMMKKYLESMSHGGTMGILNLSNLKTLPVIVPPMDLQIKFASFVNQVNKSRVIFVDNLISKLIIDKVVLDG